MVFLELIWIFSHCSLDCAFWISKAQLRIQVWNLVEMLHGSNNNIMYVCLVGQSAEAAGSLSMNLSMWKLAVLTSSCHESTFSAVSTITLWNALQEDCRIQIGHASTRFPANTIEERFFSISSLSHNVWTNVYWKGCTVFVWIEAWTSISFHAFLTQHLYLSLASIKTGTNDLIPSLDSYIKSVKCWWGNMAARWDSHAQLFLEDIHHICKVRSLGPSDACFPQSSSPCTLCALQLKEGVVRFLMHVVAAIGTLSGHHGSHCDRAKPRAQISAVGENCVWMWDPAFLENILLRDPWLLFEPSLYIQTNTVVLSM